MISKPLLSLTLLSVFLCSCSTEYEIKDLTNPSATKISSLPRLYTDDSGVLAMSWVEQESDTSKLYYSMFRDNIWDDKKMISKSANWFVNWADFPSVISSKGIPIASHWLQKIPGNTYSYNVEIAPFKNEQFSDSFVPHTDGTSTEHGFVSMLPLSDSSFYAIWLDGRNTAGGDHDSHGSGGLATAMTLRGASFSTNGTMLNEAELDNSVCDCCNTSITKIENGLLIAYRDRTSEEVRDIYVKRMIDGVWEESNLVFNDHWEIAACPVNGPALSSKDKTVAIAWFTGANEQAKVKLSFSFDEGKTFDRPIIIDQVSPLGRVDVLMENDNSAWISWMSRTENGAILAMRLVSSDGKILNQKTISEINPSRRTGFPQISKTENNKIMVAWTNYNETKKSVRTVILE